MPTWLAARPSHAAPPNRTGTAPPYATPTAGPGAITQTAITGAGTQTITPVLSQTLDRWGQAITSVNALGYTTTTKYDQAGRVIEVQLPQTDVARANGSVVRANPVTRNHYDSLGRLIAEYDANSADQVATGGASYSTRHQYNAAGQELKTIAADGGVSTTRYDGLGRKVGTTDALGHDATWTYNRNNQVLSVAHMLEEERYTYDEMGHRKTSTLHYTLADGSAGLATKDLTTQYLYDTRGKVLRTVQPGGQQDNATYDYRGNKLTETNANGDTATWNYNTFGKLVSHTDLGGQITSTSYGLAGEQTSLTSIRNGTAARNIRNEYDGRGQLRKIIDNGAGTITEYSYDAAGQRTREAFFRTATSGATAGAASALVRDTRIKYDELGRISRVTDGNQAGSQSAGGHSTLYTYDASVN